MNKFDDIYFNLKLGLTKGELKSQVEDRPAEYEFRVTSHLSEQWAEWFDGLEIRYDDQGNTLIRGVIADQAALHGLLSKIRDLNLILISITRK